MKKVNFVTRSGNIRSVEALKKGHRIVPKNRDLSTVKNKVTDLQRVKITKPKMNKYKVRRESDKMSTCFIHGLTAKEFWDQIDKILNKGNLKKRTNNNG